MKINEKIKIFFSGIAGGIITAAAFVFGRKILHNRDSVSGIDSLEQRAESTNQRFTDTAADLQRNNSRLSELLQEIGNQKL